MNQFIILEKTVESTAKAYCTVFSRIIGLLLLFSLNAYAEKQQNETYCFSFFKPICQRIHQIWTEGSNELYLSGYAWHNRYTYPAEKIKTYNEAAWGGGFGKGLFDEKGNWHGLSAIAFLDSHSNLEPAAGYAYLKIANFHNEFKAGIGYSLLITSRKEINHGVPFPGVLPWASIIFKKITLSATYVPGFNHNGNVLYLLGKYTF